MKIKNKGVFLFAVFFLQTVLLTLTSTSFNQVIPLSLNLRRAMNALIYVPFAVIICRKLFFDIKQIKQKKCPSALSALYYIFAAYYVLISCYRLFSGQEVKENLYYTIVLTASIAVFIEIKEKDLDISREEFRLFVLLITSYLTVYRLLYVFIFDEIFRVQPVNIILTTGISAFLLPVQFDIICDRNTGKAARTLSMILSVITLIIVFSAGSRSMFWMTLVIVVIKLLFSVKEIKGRFLPSLFPVALSFVIVACMLILNVGTMRYALSRESGINFLTKEDMENSDGKIPDDISSELLGGDLTAAEIQIMSSDNMRKTLIGWGLEQVAREPFFGTGDVLYEYRLGEDRVYQQSSHNFVLETLVCYGAIGTIILLGIIFAAAISMGFIPIKLKSIPPSRVTTFLIILFVFGIGFVEQTTYNVLVCPVCFIALASHRDDGDDPVKTAEEEIRK